MGQLLGNFLNNLEVLQCHCNAFFSGTICLVREIMSGTTAVLLILLWDLNSYHSYFNSAKKDWFLLIVHKGVSTPPFQNHTSITKIIPFFLEFPILHFTNSVYWGINCPSKAPLSSCLPRPLLNLPTVQASLFGLSPLYVGFSWTLPP